MSAAGEPEIVPVEDVEVVTAPPRNLAVETGRLIGLLAGVVLAGWLSSRGERTS